ncbi:hypothetical protein TSOC_009275 [Tetrabaena socialis]|uniref:phytol kinase n=1 Tax=Tetrabaena socialis TaxID=47790 RepID=A0A2J7ZWA0_9CHLO|nr:hypothetical protein TSOC_009275 [Tetrabaena socialis]|eukprot:PNH04547.1 hypothetical protein TSOC_009275 [Tetrabaena socialis]
MAYNALCEASEEISEQHAEQTTNDDPDEQAMVAAGDATARLAMRMDVLPACCALLAAGRADARLLLPLGQQVNLARLLCRTISLLTTGGPGVQTPDRALAHQRSVLETLALSGATEHFARAVVELALACRFQQLPAASSQQPPPNSTAAPSQQSGLELWSPENAEINLLRVELAGLTYDFRILGCAQTSIASANVTAALVQATSRDGGEASEGGDAPQDHEQATMHRRAILFGPCLQYALAAGVVAQLAEADGGTQYGLGDEQTLPPLYKREAEDARTLRHKGRPVAPRCLLVGGLSSALKLWAWCLKQSPPMPLSPCSRRAVRALALRTARVAASSAVHHMAVRRQQQQQQEQPAQQRQTSQQQQQQRPSQQCGPGVQGAGGGHAGSSFPGAAAAGAGSSGAHGPYPGATPPLPQLVAPLQDRRLGSLAIEALQCAALTMRRPPVLCGETVPPGGGAGAAADRAAAEWWGTAAAALHVVVSQRVESEDERIPPPGLEEMGAHVPTWPGGDLPPSPPPNLAAALAAGYLPLLERSLRALQHAREQRAGAAVPANSTARIGELLDPLCAWPLLGRLPAYGDPRQAAALLATTAKLIGRLRLGGEAEDEAAWRQRWRGVFGDADNEAADNEAAELKEEGEETCRCWGAAPVLRRLRLLEMLLWLAAVVAEERHGSPAAAEQSAAAAAADSAVRTDGRMVPAAAAAPASGSSSDEGSAAAAAPDAALGAAPAAAAATAAAAAALPPPPPPALSGPSRQLLLMVGRAVRQWLPALSQLAVTQGSTQPVEPASSSQPAGVIAAAHVLRWVPALVHAAAQQQDGSEQGPDAGVVRLQGPVPDAARGPTAASWRSLLLVDVGVVGLLGRTLRQLGLAGEDERGSGHEGPRVRFKTKRLHEACVALECVAAAFPREVAAALADGRLPRLHRDPDVLMGGADAARLFPERRQQRERLLSALSALGGAATAAAAGAVGAAAGLLPDPCVGDGAAPASAMGALLLAAAPGAWDALLPTCSNPLCANLAGDSEADLRLRACGVCGRARYCCAECQRAHWRTGHKAVCAQPGS